MTTNLTGKKYLYGPQPAVSGAKALRWRPEKKTQPLARATGEAVAPPEAARSTKVKNCTHHAAAASKQPPHDLQKTPAGKNETPRYGEERQSAKTALGRTGNAVSAFHIRRWVEGKGTSASKQAPRKHGEKESASGGRETGTHDVLTTNNIDETTGDQTS